MKILLSFFLIIGLVLTGLAQDANSDLTQDLLEQAIKLNKEGKYQEANEKFRQILTISKSIPTEMTYHFAETLYAIGQYQNSKNFIQKYFELTGKTGDNFDQIKELERMVDEKMVAIKECHRCNAVGYRYFPCQTCQQEGTVDEACYYCKGLGVARCVKCRGDGVLISANAMGVNEYHTCDRCNGNGTETCPICEGDKTLTSDCPTCNGTLFQHSKELCDHEDHPEDGFTVPYTFEKSSN
ncbi:MAG: molecular chaperone DnaJ [Cyclobacteriaceae bacterium]